MSAFPVPLTPADAIQILESKAREVQHAGYGLEGRNFLTGAQCVAIAALLRRYVTVTHTLLDGPAGWAERSLLRSTFEPLPQPLEADPQPLGDALAGIKAMRAALEAAYSDQPRPMPDVASGHAISRDCPCDRCDQWFRTHGDEDVAP